MAVVSRTVRVIQNAKVALIFYCINLFLQFFSRKIFLDYLGAELLGLNTTAQNLLQFLNLAESGIGAAVAFALYKPLSQGNRQEIIDIVSLQGWFYRWVGLFVIAGSFVLMAFFPWIFAKTQVPLIYAYGTFIAFLISSLLGYFVNYKMVVLSANQQEYKITIQTQTIKVFKVLTQMMVIWAFSYGYVWWMVVESTAAIITCVCLTHCVEKEFPWLISDVSNGKALRDKYNFILVKTRQVFFHRIGGYVLNQATPLIIYVTGSLTLVAIYGNYMIVLFGALLLVDALFRGFNSSVGNLVTEGVTSKIVRIFWELYTIRLYLASVICIGIFYLSNSFVTLWIGREYILSEQSLAILVAIYFIQMSRTADIFLAAYGLFRDVWAPIVEAILNIGLSLLLGSFYGISGIFCGVLISQLVVVNSWKPYFLFKEGFKRSFHEYVVIYTKKIFLILISAILHALFFLNSSFLVAESIYDWLISSFIIVSTYAVICLSLFYIFDISFRLVVQQIFIMVSQKFRKFHSNQFINSDNRRIDNDM